MLVNGDKSYTVRNCTVKEGRYYFAPWGEKIKFTDSMRDLGIQVSKDRSYKDQIMVARRKANWILRVFKNQSLVVMKIIFKSLVLPHLDLRVPGMVSQHPEGYQLTRRCPEKIFKMLCNDVRVPLLGMPQDDANDFN